MDENVQSKQGKIEERTMDIFHVLTMLGGLCLFLFGMNFMGQSLERRAGGKNKVEVAAPRGAPPAPCRRYPQHITYP